MQDKGIDWERLGVLIESSVTAGRYFAARLSTKKQVTEKTSAADVVTEVDKACETIIRNLVARDFPTDAILGEEGTAPGVQAASSAVADVADTEHLWVIDPLDGTTNFVSQIPLSVVSLAYVHAGQVMLGAVYDPYRDELFYAVRGAGAWLTSGDDAVRKAEAWLTSGNDVAQQAKYAQRLPGLSLTASRVEQLKLAIVASGFPTRAADRDRSLMNGMAIVKQAKSLRGFGAAALHLAYVAAGRIDGFWEYDLNAWDIAAGSLLVEEAGGVVMDISGAAYQLAVRNVVACGHPGLAQVIHEALVAST